MLSFKIAAHQQALLLGHVLALDVNLPSHIQRFAIPQTALYQQRYLYRIVDGRLQRATLTLHGPLAGEPDFVVVSTQLSTKTN